MSWENNIEMKLALKVAGTFAVIGYSVAIAIYFAPVSWHVSQTLLFTFFPPVLLPMIGNFDPSLTSMALILAPLNALLYGGVGLLLGGTADELGIVRRRPR